MIINANKLKPIILQGRSDPWKFQTNPSSDHAVVIPVFKNHGYAVLAYYSALSFQLYTDIKQCDFRIATNNDMIPFMEEMFPGVPLVSGVAHKYSFLEKLAHKKRLTIIDADLFCTGNSNQPFPFFQMIMTGMRSENSVVMGCQIPSDCFYELNARLPNRANFEDLDQVLEAFRDIGGPQVFRDDTRWFQAWLTSLPINRMKDVFWELVNYFRWKWHSDETIYMAYLQSIGEEPELIDSYVKLHYPYIHPEFPSLSRENLFDHSHSYDLRISASFQLAHPCGYPPDHERVWSYYTHLLALADAHQR